MLEIKCPFCNSTQISASKKGFSVGKAAIGALAFGGWGLLAGGIGKNKVIVTCLNCGKSWEAGSHKAESKPLHHFSEEEHKLRQAELNAQIELARIELEAEEAQDELDELKYVEEQKKEREKNVAENKLLAATMCVYAFSEAVAKLNRARKQYNFDKDALITAFDEIIGEELSNAIHHILELDQTSSCYETLKQEVIDLAISEKSLYTGALKIVEK